MAITILDPTVAAAVAAATSQEAQRAALLAPFGSADVTVRALNGATLRETMTYGAWVTDNLTPRGATLGPLLARSVASTGAPTSFVFRAGSTDVFSMTGAVSPESADIVLASNIAPGPRTNIADGSMSKVTLFANPALPATSGFATAFTLTLSASSGTNGIPITVTVTPNGPIQDNGASVTLTASFGGVLGTTSLSFTSGSTTAQNTTLTRVTAGVSSVTMTNNRGLANIGSGATFTSTAVVVPTSPGTVTTLGTTNLTAHLGVVRSNMGPVTGESLAQANARMGPAQNILDYCGMCISADGRYLEFAINAGHSATGDDGFYRYDLQAEAFVYPPVLFPSQYGAYSGSTANTFGEYNSAPGGWGRPADQHSYTHVVRVGSNYVQAMGYGITVNGASSSKQAHIWRSSTGLWERYGSLSGGTPGEVAFCFHDTTRGRIVRFSDVANNRNIDWIPDNLSPGDATTAWTTEIVTSSGGTFEKVMAVGSGKCAGYHAGLDCFIIVSPGRLTPTNRVYVMDAGNLVGGWTEAVGSIGVTPPATIGECNLEYIPPMDAFALPSRTEPTKLYYLRPPASGVITDPWKWEVETFTGTVLPWGPSDQQPESRLRWSELKRGLVAVKSSTATPELYVPYEVAAYYDWIDRTAAAAAAGVSTGKAYAFYDFSEQPANGGDWKFGSIQASPKITVEVPQSSRTYDTPLPAQPYHERDTTVYPPGSRGSLKMTMPPGSHNSTDNWRMSVDEYSKQFGAGDEFWCCWRTKMNDTYARWRFKTAAGGITGPGTVWDGSYTEYKLWMSGYGMQFPTGCGEAAGDSATYYGYTPSANQINNLLTLHTTDVKGEIVMISKTDQQIPGPGGWMKYLQMYISKFFDNLTGRGQSISYYSAQNEGNEPGYAVRPCQFIDPGGGAGNQYTDYSTCWTFPSEEWFSIMVHVQLGAEATAASNVIGSPTRTGYVSTIEYYGAYQGQPWKLLHRKTGVVIPTDTPGAEGPCKFGLFNWTTYMTNKLSTEMHPDAVVWVSQIILQPGATMPAAPLRPTAPVLPDDNLLNFNEGTSTTGWSVTSGTGTLSQASSSVRLASTSAAVVADLSIAGPATNDFIILVNASAKYTSGQFSSLRFKDGATTMLELSFGYNHLTTAEVLGTISVTNGTTGNVLSTGVNYETTPQKFAIHIDRNFSAVNVYAQHSGGGWLFQASYSYAAGFASLDTVQMVTSADSGQWVEYDWLGYARPNIISIGDSICAGHNFFDPDPAYYAEEDNPDGQWQRWCVLYPTLRNTLIVNKGVGGQTSTQISARIASNVTVHAPRLVYLHASSNDQVNAVSKATRSSNIQTCINSVAGIGGQTILLNTMYGTAGNAINPAHRTYMAEWWGSDRLAISGLLKSVDIMAAVDSGDYMDTALTESDGIHPKPAGYQAIGELVQTLT